MDKGSKIFVAGHNGLAGSAIVRKLHQQGYNNLVLRSSKELDLREKSDVFKFFKSEIPEYVFFAAGTVGGIMANITYPADFIFNNTAMIFNTVDAAYKTNVKKLLYLGSSCIYPKLSAQPIKEEYLLTGPLEETNKPYALAKIAGIELCAAYNKQYDTNYIALMPTNLFGIKDNYDRQNSHLVAALIRKFYEAKINNSPFVELWGSGTPKREILSSDQLADACVYFMNHYDGKEVVNIGKGEDYMIKEIADMIKNISGYEGEIKYDASKPNGNMKKQLDISKAKELGWTSNSNTLEDLKISFEDFVENYSTYTL